MSALRWRYALLLLLFLPLLLLGGEYLMHLLQVVVARATYPFELEWMEGGMLQQVLQLVHRQPLYGEPSLDFVPALYMPLYYGLAALSVMGFGESLFALRMVSIVATAFILVLAFVIAKKVTRMVWAGVLAVLFVAAMFRHTGFWFDVARVDSLWTMLLLLALWQLLCWRDSGAARHLYFLACASVLAFFTKQASLFVFPFVAVAVVCWLGWRALWRYCLWCAVLGLPVLWLLQWSTGGNFVFFTLQMASSHGVTLFGLRRFVEIVVQAVPVFLLLAALSCVLVGNNRRQRGGWVAVVVGFVFVSALSRAYAGAFYNVLMPMYVCVAIAAAVALVQLIYVQTLSRWRMAGAALLVICLSLDMWRYRFNPVSQIPTATDVVAAEYLLQRIRAAQGAVCVTSHGYLGWMAGKGFCAHNTQVTDVMTGSSVAMADRLRQDAREKIMSGYYAAIVLDREKELRDLGLDFAEIPYTVSNIQYPEHPLRFPVNGYSPTLWLERKR